MVDLSAIRGLILKIRATRAHLLVLRICGAFWPFLLLLIVFSAFALIGLFARLPASLEAIAALLFWLGAGFMLWRGWRRFVLPSELEARHALDNSSELRPIHSLTDRPSAPTDEGKHLWEAHTQRLEKAAEKLSMPWFGALWSNVDPYYLRAVLPVLLISCLFVAGGRAGERFGRALVPDVGVLMGADNVTVEAWITPPEHTRRPPVFLRTDLDDVRVPAGSEVTVRAQARSAPRLVLRGTNKSRGQAFERTPDGAFETRAVLTEDTDIRVNWWGKRAGWSILATSDSVPQAEYLMVPVLGANDLTELTWMVRDDYGVVKLELALRLVKPHPAAPDEERRVPIELPSGSVKEASEEAVLDMTRHAWAGLMVEARLLATDGAGNEGQSAPHEFVLPEKLFLQSLARAAQDVRLTVLREPRPYDERVSELNRLEAAPEGIHRAALMLEALTHASYRFFSSYEPFLGLSTAHANLKTARTLEEAHQVDGLLWAVALKAEYGSAADALAALLAAKKALEKALRDGAPEEEIARLTDAFRQAAENYVQAKLAEAIANGLPEGAAEEGLDNQQAGGGSQGLGQNSFEDMLNALEDLTATGATGQARQLLSDITNMLENLEFQQGNGSGEDGFALPGNGTEGEEEGEKDQEQQALAEQIEALSEALREQRELSDDTLESERAERDRQRQQAQNGQQSGPQQGGPPQGGDQAGATREELAQRQAQIGELLLELAEEGSGAGEQDGEEGGRREGAEGQESSGGGLGREALEDALRAQRRAEQSLQDGQFNFAQRSQEQIMQNLQALAGVLAKELDDLRGDVDEQSRQTDPFGNPVGGRGASGNVLVPDESERQRALDILEELRRRYGEATDPQEREYLQRLLDRF